MKLEVKAAVSDLSEKNYFILFALHHILDKRFY